MKSMKSMIGAAALVCMAGTASADVWEFYWGQNGVGGGNAVFSTGTSPFWTGIKVTGPDGAGAGFREVLTTACVDMTVTLNLNYSSADTGTYDSAYYAINGNKTTFAYNNSQGPYSPVVNLQAGDVLRIGVDSADGAFGPGILDINDIEPRMDIGFGGFTWSYFSLAGSGSFTFPPPTLIDIGGNAGFTDRNDVYTQIQGPATITGKGAYSSGDTGNFDQGFSYQYEGTVVYTTFINNATQGPFTNVINHGGGSPTVDGEFGWGVYTVDGGFGAGTLTIPDFNANMLTAWMNDLPFSLAAGPGGTGSIAGGGFGVMTINGGNNGTAGLTHYTVNNFAGGAANDYCVQARATYTSTDSACWDSAAYIIDGVETVIACNNAPGTYNLSFNVKRGQTLGFGVRTADGVAGAGTLVIDTLRCFEMDAAPACYPDCDGDGVLTIDDFICFQTFFAIADPYADCDGDGVLTIDDFICFQTFFAIGC
jgi:hypothetical protein